jgi:hypothetical protein
MTFPLGVGRSTADVRHLGLLHADPALDNGGDRVLLRSFNGVGLDCHSWGLSRWLAPN